MSIARDLLAELKSLGVEVTPNGDKLKVKAPVGIITPTLRDRLTEAKPELLRLLAANERAFPHVWRFTIDGKPITAIDYERRTYAEMLADMQSKFGAERVLNLEGAGHRGHA